MPYFSSLPHTVDVEVFLFFFHSSLFSYRLSGIVHFLGSGKELLSPFSFLVSVTTEQHLPQHGVLRKFSGETPSVT